MTEVNLQEPVAGTEKPKYPCPVYFISRSSGVLVPLIAADELPLNIRLQGVPRVLQYDQTRNMHHLGTIASNGTTYKLQEGDNLAKQPSTSNISTAHLSSQNGSKFLAPDAFARQNLAQSMHAPKTGTTSQPRMTPRHLASNWRPTTPSSPSDSVIAETQAKINAILASPAKPAVIDHINAIPRATTTLPPSGLVPNDNNKEYCTYWLRTGNCDFVQQGCLYKHEMPDKETLKKIGFHVVPKWWEKKMATKSVLKMSVRPSRTPTKQMSGPKIGQAMSNTSDSDETPSKHTKASGRFSVVKAPQDLVREPKSSEIPLIDLDIDETSIVFGPLQLNEPAPMTKKVQSQDEDSTVSISNDSTLVTNKKKSAKTPKTNRSSTIRNRRAAQGDAEKK